MIYGVIRGIAQVWIHDCWEFRLLVVQQHSWRYLYIGASNYRFRIGDIVSWSANKLCWHADKRSVWFDLLQSEVTTS